MSLDPITDEQEDFYEHYRFIADEGQDPLRIDKFLMNRLANTSRNRIQNAAKLGYIRVADKAVKQNYKVKAGDEVSIVLPTPPRDKELKAENIPLDIIYEDEEVTIINKPAGMVVHPGYNNFDGTLVNALLYHYENLPTGKNGEERPGLIHRIDKDTSGLLVTSRNEESMTHLANQFYNHTIKRHYKALVWGEPKDDEGTIDTQLARSQKDRRKMDVYEKPEIGKRAITHYKVIEKFGYASLVDCWLETGRTHQIRAHMKHLGHPLFADEWYGGMKINYGPSFSKYKQFIHNCFEVCPRQALHAYSLGFKHPRTGEELYFEKELPADFSALLEKWRKFAKFQLNPNE